MIAITELPGGVIVEPVPPEKGSTVLLGYSGLLAQQGADRIYARVGYGDPHHWFGVKEYEMQKRDRNYFEVTFKVENSESMHVCFRDAINNWDNNNGHNWSLPVQSESS